MLTALRDWLATLCGRIGVLFINLSGILDPDTGAGIVYAMSQELDVVMRQQRFREAEKDRIRTPGR